MTTHTTLRARPGVMIQWLGRAYLSLWWRSRPDLMTFVASFFLMFGVTKANTESLREFRSAPVAA
ncbi:MAG TPA: hypothetical protein VJ784_19425 [Pyrinomonadaceae bacterium]|nr:hypothetical protein [Pyrinomonadaceae bacterium]